MPRRTWLDSKIDVFLEELAASGTHKLHDAYTAVAVTATRTSTA